MKTRLLLVTLSAFAALPVFAKTQTATTPTATTPPSAQTAPAPAAQDKLVLVVSVPPSMHPFRDDDVAVALADDVRDEFARDGYRGKVDYDTSWPDRARNEKPRLELNLMEWRVTPGRVVECTFTANLVTPQGSQDLGLFSGSSLVMAGLGDPFGRADGFDEAARDAIGDLQRTLAEKNLLPFATRAHS